VLEDVGLAVEGSDLAARREVRVDAGRRVERRYPGAARAAAFDQDPLGTSSTSIAPAAICSSLAVGVPGRTENAAISFFTWLFSARIWPRVAPGSPRELQTRVSSFVR
jgi:hypothetical protein